MQYVDARKLAVPLHRMWIEGILFRWSTEVEADDINFGGNERNRNVLFLSKVSKPCLAPARPVGTADGLCIGDHGFRNAPVGPEQAV